MINEGTLQIYMCIIYEYRFALRGLIKLTTCIAERSFQHMKTYLRLTITEVMLCHVHQEKQTNWILLCLYSLNGTSKIFLMVCIFFTSY